MLLRKVEELHVSLQYNRSTTGSRVSLKGYGYGVMVHAW
jgi:hypothetical protein